MVLMNSKTCAACLLLVLASQAQAEGFLEGKKLYGTVFVGVTQTEDYNFDNRRVSTGVIPSSATVTISNGASAGLIFGVHLSPVLRAEFEISHSSNDTGSLLTTSSTSRNPLEYEGKFDATFGMANIWYDPPVKGRFKPYVGGGLGVAHVSHDATITLFTSDAVNDSDTVFAAQIGFGGRIDVGANGTLDFGYRYKVTDDVKFKALSVPSATNMINGNYVAHTVSIGYSYNF